MSEGASTSVPEDNADGQKSLALEANVDVARSESTRATSSWVDYVTPATVIGACAVGGALEFGYKKYMHPYSEERILKEIGDLTEQEKQLFGSESGIPEENKQKKSESIREEMDEWRGKLASLRTEDHLSLAEKIFHIIMSGLHSNYIRVKSFFTNDEPVHEPMLEKPYTMGYAALDAEIQKLESNSDVNSLLILYKTEKDARVDFIESCAGWGKFIDIVVTKVTLRFLADYKSILKYEKELAARPGNGVILEYFRVLSDLRMRYDLQNVSYDEIVVRFSNAQAKLEKHNVSGNTDDETKLEALVKILEEFVLFGQKLSNKIQSIRGRKDLCELLSKNIAGRTNTSGSGLQDCPTVSQLQKWIDHPRECEKETILTLKDRATFLVNVEQGNAVSLPQSLTRLLERSTKEVF